MNRSLKPDLLAGLAQRGFDRGLAGVDFAAGKGDLARMGAQLRRPKREQNIQSARPRDDRRQHGRRTGAGEDIGAGSGPPSA